MQATESGLKFATFSWVGKTGNNCSIDVWMLAFLHCMYWQPDNFVVFDNQPELPTLSKVPPTEMNTLKSWAEATALLALNAEYE